LPQEKIIELIELSKTYKGLKAVSNLNLTVYRGDVFGFLGPNGAGKSTTIRMMLSLIKPTSGEINIFGKPLLKNRLEILKKIGAIVEKPDFYLYLTAYKNLEILAGISGIKVTKKKIMDILELVDLENRWNSNVKTFSYGMKQRLGIAQALIHDPELIILDEPTTGLDPQGVKEIRELIIKLSQENGKTIFLSSHILSEVQMIANRITILNQGTTVVQGPIKDFISPDNLKVRFELSDIYNVLNILKASPWHDKILTHSEKDVSFQLQKMEISRLNRFFVEQHVAVNAIIPANSLEEYFLEITGKNNSPKGAPVSEYRNK